MDEEFRQYRREQAAKWLSHVRSLGARVRALQSEIDEQRELASGLKGIAYDGIPGQGSTPDGIPNAVARIEELIGDYLSELAGYVEEQRIAHEALSKISDEACRSALVLHYLAGKPWRDVAQEMAYSVDGIMSLRRRALEMAYEVMPFYERDPLPPAI